ncbi:hypothetical protein LBMAG56_39580 [Verrucomicrobiota bacterium]|nr:hypothetical protein LBMAG56_39580 [Verrucomicrobiota bacterium]
MARGVEAGFGVEDAGVEEDEVVVLGGREEGQKEEEREQHGAAAGRRGGAAEKWGQKNEAGDWAFHTEHLSQFLRWGQRL